MLKELDVLSVLLEEHPDQAVCNIVCQNKDRQVLSSVERIHSHPYLEKRPDKFQDYEIPL